MSREYFENALHNFIKDFNYSGAIIHLTCKGFSLRKIKDYLGGNLPDAFIKEQMIKAYQEHDLLRTEEPGVEKRERISMVKEVGAYGRVSYRQIKEVIESPGLPLVERIYDPRICGSFLSFLEDRLSSNLDPSLDGKKAGISKKSRKNGGKGHTVYGENQAYISLRVTRRRLEKWSAFLDQDQVDYLECFTDFDPMDQIFYFKADTQIIAIISRLYEEGCYQGNAYFLKLGQKWVIKEILKS